MRKFSAFHQISFIFGFVGKYLWDTDKVSLGITLLLNIFYSVVIVPILLLDKVFIDALVSNIQNPNPIMTFRMVVLVISARFTIQALRNLSQRVSGYYARILFMHLRQQTEVLIGEKYATIGVEVIEDPKFKDRYQKIEREGMERLIRVAENFVRIPQHIFGIVSSLSLFVLTQPIIVIISLVSLIPTAWVERVFIKKDYELDTQLSIRHRIRGMYSYLLARQRSYMELRLLNVYHYLANRIREIWEEIIHKRVSLMRQWRTWSYLSGLVDDAVSYSLDGLFAFQVLIGKISIGTSQAYIRAITTFKTNVSSLTMAVLALYENYLYLTDLVWFLNLESPYFNSSGQKLILKDRVGIQFKNVSFKYPGTDNFILQDISFQIKPGENVAIIGENGIGKTTLVKLLCGFYEPTSGEILINGKRVSELNKIDYWKKISVLFQDFEGYNITARESIAVSKIGKISDTEEIKKYARMSDIDKWIESLPLQYDNPLGRDFDKGVIPSSGQWQRIGIARTLMKDTPIMVLDEPTSNVDPQAEESIFNKILELGEKKILIFISHRFSTVRRADKIIVLDKGTVLERGSHQELMAKNGKYAHLFNLQAKSYH